MLRNYGLTISSNSTEKDDEQSVLLVEAPKSFTELERETSLPVADIQARIKLASDALKLHLPQTRGKQSQNEFIEQLNVQVFCAVAGLAIKDNVVVVVDEVRSVKEVARELQYPAKRIHNYIDLVKERSHPKEGLVKLPIEQETVLHALKDCLQRGEMDISPVQQRVLCAVGGVVIEGNTVRVVGSPRPLRDVLTELDMSSEAAQAILDRARKKINNYNAKKLKIASKQLRHRRSPKVSSDQPDLMSYKYEV